MSPEIYNIDPSDCCGNGCANCILDSTPKQSDSSISNDKSLKNAIITYRNYKLVEQITLMPRILQLKFKLIDKETEISSLMLDIPPGHHIMMRAPDLNTVDNSNKLNSSDSCVANCKKFTRPYSPFNVNSKSLEMEILVNLAPNGSMSRYIQQLKVGDFVEFRGPVGSFFHEPNFCETLIIFTHGVAIAPVLRIIDQILDNADDMTRIHFNCCFTNLHTILFRDRLHKYNNYWNFVGNIYLSHEECFQCEVGYSISEGMCSHFKKKLKYNENIKPFRLVERGIVDIFSKLNKNSCRIVICGSKSFERFIVDALGLVDFNKESIFIL